MTLTRPAGSSCCAPGVIWGLNVQIWLRGPRGACGWFEACSYFLQRES